MLKEKFNDEMFCDDQDNIYSVIYTLLAAKARGEHAICKFEGHTLDSDTVSLDSTIMEVYGLTQDKYDNYMKKKVPTINPKSTGVRMEYMPNDNIESIVYRLLAAKERGENLYFNFNGHILHSYDVTMEGAWQEITGGTKEEHEEWKKKLNAGEIEELDLGDFNESERIRKENNARYAEKVAARKNPEDIITNVKIVNGLKFIAEHQTMPQDDLIDGLLDLGCAFSTDDVRLECIDSDEEIDMKEALKKGYPAWGAFIICTARDSDNGRSYVNDRYLTRDDNDSMYHYIRVMSKDPTYTKDVVDEINAANSVHK